MERIDLDKYIVLAIAAWTWIKVWYDRISKIIEPLVKKVEELSQDGLIDTGDRKKIVMLAISELEKEGRIKLNFLSRIVIGKVVDHIAKKLPDFIITLDAPELINAARSRND